MPISTCGSDVEKKVSYRASSEDKANEKKPKPYSTVYYASGEQYKGEWKDNKQHGQGVVTYKNGDKYGGDWVAGKRHGNGTLWVLRDGQYKVRYSGDWQDDLPEGSGLLFDDEGNSYEGEMHAGLRHGRGRSVTACAAPAGTKSCHSQATVSVSSDAAVAAGDVYEGCWQHDKRHGPGTLMLANGDMYEGHWEQDMKHGSGTFFYMSKGCRYDGTWRQGTACCGSYSEIQPLPPGARGCIPNIELYNPDQVLQEAAAAAAQAGCQIATAAAEAAGSAIGSSSGSWGRRHDSCTVAAAAFEGSALMLQGE